MMIDTNQLVIFDPVTRTLYGPGEFSISMNGLATQLTLMADRTEMMAMQIFQDAPAANPPKKKRKVSKYQREFGRQMKKLKAAHPRTPVTKLMSRGHSATRKALGMKQKRRSR